MGRLYEVPFGVVHRIGHLNMPLVGCIGVPPL